MSGSGSGVRETATVGERTSKRGSMLSMLRLAGRRTMPAAAQAPRRGHCIGHATAQGMALCWAW